MSTAICHTLERNFAFVLAGNAVFTVSNPHGQRYTYRVRTGKCRCGGSPACTLCRGDGKLRHFKTKEVMYFVQLLTGPDNDASYTYLGMMRPESVPMFTLTAKSKMRQDSQPVRVVQWAFNVLKLEKPIPEGYTIQHAGKCGKCGRTLTVPESIETGLGPVCAGRM